jgi:hypothetical protein
MKVTHRTGGLILWKDTLMLRSWEHWRSHFHAEGTPIRAPIRIWAMFGRAAQRH